MSHTDELEESQFEVVSDVEVSLRDRYFRIIDNGLITPLRILLNDWRGLTGTAITMFFVLVGTIGVILIPRPTTNAGPRYIQPFQTIKFPLGTDGLGQGVFAQLVHATPAMLIMILSGGVFAITVATIVGTISGYKGGRIDSITMTLSDTMIALPGLPLVMVITTIFAPKNPVFVGILLAINRWAGLARTLRSQVLTLREESYVEASRIMGVSNFSIIAEDILPNLMPYILINFVGAARSIIFGSVALYFLGVLPFSNFNWGVMMNMANEHGNALIVPNARHWILFPMLAIVLLSLGLVLVAQGADRLFNVRLRSKHASQTPDETE